MFSSTLRIAAKLSTITKWPKAHLLANLSTRQASTDVQLDSFIQNIFTGEAKVSAFFPYPKILTPDELSFVEMVTEPAVRLYNSGDYDALKVEEAGQLEEKHLQLLKDMGAFGVEVPAEYGGMNCNNTQFARLAELTSGEDLGISVMLGAHQAIGFKGILLYGSDAQKQRYLPSLATGEKIAAFALTEPSAGSDASGIKSRAVLSEDGTYWILNGSKTYISNGGIADYFTVFAQTSVKNNGEAKDKVTAFWVERGDGLTNGPPMHKMGIKVSNTAEVYFDNVRIPTENVIGQVGAGFKVAMNILNNGRYGHCCALSGTMKKAIQIATEHVNNRAQFGNKLAAYTGIQEKIARMTMHHYVTQSMAYMLSGLIDGGMKDFQLEAAVSKIYASEAAWYVVDECLQILGGMGYMRETGVEKMLRDVRIFRIFEGTSEILRLFVALTGMQFAGGHLREIQRAMKNPVANLGMIFDEGSRRIRRSVGLDVPDLGDFVHASLRQEAKWLAKNIRAFSSSVEDLLVKHQRNIIHEQIALMRLGTAAIDIYTMLVVLSRATRGLEKNVASAEIERRMAKVICSEASRRVERNLRSLQSDTALQNDETLKIIGREVIQNGSVVHSHPLD